MKRYLRVGERYALSKRKPIYLTTKYFSLLAVLSLMCLYAAKQASAQQAEPAAPAVEDIQPIEIGSPIPDGLWSAPLTSWTAADNRTETITLDDYRGKVIILDFWATWCKSCIANMPRMHELQSQFEDDVVVLPVTYEDRSTVSALLDKTKNTGLLALKPSFQSIIVDSILRNTFPNPDRTIPYFAIIGKDGMLTGLSMPAQLDEQLLASLISGEETYIAPLQPAPETPLLERSPKYRANRVAKPVYYSMLSGYMDGFSFPVGYQLDSVKNIRRDYYINASLLRLYASALSNGAPIRPNARILLIDSPERVEYNRRRNPNYNYHKYSYCYESVSPIHTSEEERNARMLSELNTVSGFWGEMRRHELPCLVINIVDSFKYFNFSPTNEGEYISMKAFVRRLNFQNQTTLPMVIDESGFEGKLFFDASIDPSDIEGLQKLLGCQGFTLERQMRMQDVFVLSDNDIPDVDSIPLTLTKFGYVRKETEHE